MKLRLSVIIPGGVRMNQRRKVGIIGIGHVGSHVASALITRGLCEELVLIDKDEALAKGQMIDLSDTAAYRNAACQIYVGDYMDLSDADIIVISVGGKLFDENRLEELGESKEIIDEIAPKIENSGFHGIVISVTNPCDLVAYYLSKKISATVFGSGTALDSARFRRRIADKLEVNVNSVQAWCFGEHGDSQVPIWSQVHVNGIPLKEYLELTKSSQDVQKLMRTVTESTVYAGWEIASAKGSTEFGIGMTVSELVKCIYEDAQMVLPCSVLLQGEYGEKDIYASVLSVISANGAKPLGEPMLSDEELEAFHKSCEIMRGYL